MVPSTIIFLYGFGRSGYWTGGVYERLADPGGMGIVGVDRFRAFSGASCWKKGHGSGL